MLNILLYDFILQVFLLHKPRKRNQSREQKLKASSQCEPSSPRPDSGSRRPRVALSLNIDSLWTVSFTLLNPQCVLKPFSGRMHEANS